MLKQTKDFHSRHTFLSYVIYAKKKKIEFHRLFRAVEKNHHGFESIESN